MRDWLNMVWYGTRMFTRDLSIAIAICLAVMACAFCLAFLMELRG